jgi:hypothetical protein
MVFETLNYTHHFELDTLNWVINHIRFHSYFKREREKIDERIEKM